MNFNPLRLFNHLRGNTHYVSKPSIYRKHIWSIRPCHRQDVRANWREVAKLNINLDYWETLIDRSEWWFMGTTHLPTNLGSSTSKTSQNQNFHAFPHPLVMLVRETTLKFPFYFDVIHILYSLVIISCTIFIHVARSDRKLRQELKLRITE